MQIETLRLKLVLQTRADVERTIEAMSAFERAQVSPDWLARMRASDEGNPWLRGFSVVLLGDNTAVGTCGYKAAAHDDVRLVIAHTLPEGAASKRVLTKCGFRYMGETVDPEDGTVSRFERQVGDKAGAK